MSLRLDTTGYSLLFSRGFRGAPKLKAGSDSLNAGREKIFCIANVPRAGPFTGLYCSRVKLEQIFI